jgi:hypothetical protein
MSKAVNTPATLNWRTYPMGGKGAEYMERRGKTAFLSHAVNLDTGRTLCGVRADFICLDDSLASQDLPECPKCAARVRAALDKGSQ